MRDNSKTHDFELKHDRHHREPNNLLTIFEQFTFVKPSANLCSWQLYNGNFEPSIMVVHSLTIAIPLRKTCQSTCGLSRSRLALAEAFVGTSHVVINHKVSVGAAHLLVFVLANVAA